MAWLVYVKYEYPWMADRGYQFSDRAAAETYFRHLMMLACGGATQAGT